MHHSGIDTKSPKNQPVEKTGEIVLPTKAVVRLGIFYWKTLFTMQMEAIIYSLTKA